MTNSHTECFRLPERLDLCLNCGKSKDKHTQYRDAKPPHCPSPNLSPLACPFCGKAPEIGPWHGGAATKTMISCPSCEVGPCVTGETKLEAVEKWNTRAND